MQSVKYSITNQDRDAIFSTTDPESINIQLKTRDGVNGIRSVAINVYFSNILVGSFDTFTEAAEFLDDQQHGIRSVALHES